MITRLLACILGLRLLAAAATPEPDAPVSRYDVLWDSPSADSRGSMPLGNGDVALNVWVEPTGDLVFYISKADAWGDNAVGTVGHLRDGNRSLIKIGRVRVRLSPGLPVAGAPFSQHLDLQRAEIDVTAGKRGDETRLRVWVDANRPVVHVEAESDQPTTLEASFESLRPEQQGELGADTVVPGDPRRVLWYYRNQNHSVAQLDNLTFGADVRGDDMVVEGDRQLRSSMPAKEHALSACVLSAQTPTGEAWCKAVAQVRDQADAVHLEDARRQHQLWWAAFWDRSWVFARGSAEADQVTQGYTLQRFVTACAGRGRYPIKFNGSLFTMDWVSHDKVQGVERVRTMIADHRDWGGQYWFQNTRAMYWPLLQSGEFEMMMPLFRMYRDQLPGNTRAVREYYHHDGAYFAETSPFWGIIPRITPTDVGAYTKHYFTPILELSAMMLDYFAYTGDRAFVREYLLPIGEAGLTFFDQHFPHENGKLVLDPDNAIETYWKARNPAPDIAGLRWVIGGLLSLPRDLTSEEQRQRWTRLLAEVPDLPKGTRGATPVLLPAERFDKTRNFENPELYSIFPFRIYGLEKPDLGLAQATFAARLFREQGCWRQDGIQAALLGDTVSAKRNVTYVLKRKDPQCRFPAFWDRGSDYVPDEDNGGNGMSALQLMALQGEGRRIILLPAWPREWDASFRLRAPLMTTVEGEVRGGRVVSLRVTPSERRSDIILAPGFSQ